jgi:hypothetical protein
VKAPAHGSIRINILTFFLNLRQKARVTQGYSFSKLKLCAIDGLIPMQESVKLQLRISKEGEQVR